jgi:hypothetical protein
MGKMRHSHRRKKIPAGLGASRSIDKNAWLAKARAVA